MRKYLFLLIFTSYISAFDAQTASKIFNKIFTAIFPYPTIKVYTKKKEYQEVIVLAPALTLVNNIAAADILLVDAWSEIPNENALVFTTNPSIFKKYKHAIGAFYWEHGRPKIVFLQNRLKIHHIILSPLFQRYIVKEIQ